MDAALQWHTAAPTCFFTRIAAHVAVLRAPRPAQATPAAACRRRWAATPPLAEAGPAALPHPRPPAASNVCYQRWTVDWRVATVGPIFMCGGDGSNSTVTFKWNGNGEPAAASAARAALRHRKGTPARQ